jgi:hypothetical protein
VLPAEAAQPLGTRRYSGAKQNDRIVPRRPPAGSRSSAWDTAGGGRESCGRSTRGGSKRQERGIWHSRAGATYMRMTTVRRPFWGGPQVVWSRVGWRRMPDKGIILTVAAPDLATRVQRLLDELCTDLGFCLPASEQIRLCSAPPLESDAFTDAVFIAEGMDPSLHKQLRRTVRAKIATRMSEMLRTHQAGQNTS